MNFVLCRSPVSVEKALKVIHSNVSIDEKQAKFSLCLLSFTQNYSRRFESDDQLSKFVEDFLLNAERLTLDLFSILKKHNEAFMALALVLDFSLNMLENLKLFQNKTFDPRRSIRIRMSSLINRLQKDSENDSSSKIFQDWRVIRKLMGPIEIIAEFSGEINKEILISFAAHIRNTLDLLGWNPKNRVTNFVKETLEILLKMAVSDNEAISSHLIKGIISGRLDRKLYGLKNTLIIGNRGGLFALINRNTAATEAMITEAATIPLDYLQRNTDRTTQKILINKDPIGKVKLSISLLSTRLVDVGEILFVKKTYAENTYPIKSLSDNQTFISSSLEKIFRNYLI